MPTQIDVFIDYVCPFCFLLEPALQELRRERDIEVRIRPFELRPHPVPTLRPEDDYLPRVWRESVYPMSERVGLAVTLPTVSPQPRTEKAFMVLQLAQEQGVAEEYTTAMFSAFFQHNRDIGQEQVIVDIASSIGIKEAEVQAALRSEDRRAQQRADQDYAVHTVGIRSVPSVMIEGTVLPGVPSSTRLKKVIDELHALHELDALPDLRDLPARATNSELDVP